MEGSLNSGKQNVFKNNVGIRRNPCQQRQQLHRRQFAPMEQNNSWNLCRDAELNGGLREPAETAAKAPRQADGSLPDGLCAIGGRQRSD
jgi:hypothetical protein